MITERYARLIELPQLPVADWTRIPNDGEMFQDGTNVYMGDGVTAAASLTPINGGGGGGGGDVVGPASATDNAIARYNLTTGKLIQNSTVLVDDNGKLGQVDAIDLDTTPTSAPAEGRIMWDSTEGSPKAGLSGGNVTALLGTDLHVLAYNNTGSPIAKGKVVRVSGSSGLRLTIALARGNADINSADTIGLTAETIGNNSSGYVITRGLIGSLNTNAFNEGDVLYLSPDTAGEITNTKPSAPNHMVRVGYCLKKAGGAGIIYVDPLNGFELNELHDVRITTPATNTVGLFWNATDSVWENKTPANARTELGLGTAATVNTGTGSGDVPTITQADARYAMLYAPSFLAYTGGNQNTTSVTLADIHSSAAWSSVAPGFYKFEVRIVHNSAATTTGVAFALNGTATIDYLSGIHVYNPLTGDRAAYAMNGAFNSASASVSSIVANSAMSATITGHFNVTVSGNVRLVFATEIAGSQIQVTGMTGFIQRIN
jgi:hypothetical protein